MIKDRNIADDAYIQVHKILGSAGMFLTGELFWVGNDGDAAYDAMKAKVPANRLYTNMDTCVGAMTANRGDVMVLMEGYNMEVNSAGALDLDVAGITIVFLGSGTSKAKITFGSAVTADMDVDAADITLINPKFVAGIDSLQGPIDVNSTDFTMINAEYHDATDIETLDAVIATAGATRLKIHGYKYFSTTETADLKQSHIQLNGCDDIDLKDIDIRGNFFVGNIENVTDEVLNARFENVYLENLNATPKPAMFIDANATGSCKNVKCKIYSGSTYVSNVGKLSWDSRCEGFMGDGYAGEPIGTVLSTGIEGKIDIIDAYHDVATADATTNAVMSDVVGNKTDAAVNAPTTTKTLMAYLKGVLNELTVPSADNTSNGFINDVIGQKTDAAASGAVTTTDTLVGYIKQLVSAVIILDEYHDVPAADNVLNAQINEVIGNKSDAAAAGAVTTTDTIVAYIKQLVGDVTSILGDTGTDGVLLGADSITAAKIGDDAISEEHFDVDSSMKMVLGEVVNRTTANLPQSTAEALFTIAGGRVLVTSIVGEVTTVIQTQANNTKLTANPTTGTSVDMCAVLDITADEVGCLYGITGTPADAMVGTNAGLTVSMGNKGLILNVGTIDLDCAASNTGQVKWTLHYIPIDVGATVTSA